MKKVLIRISKIFLITLLIAICLAFLGVAYLFLYPKGELFGIVYVSDKSSNVYTIGEYGVQDLTQIDLNTNSFDIIVDTDDSETVRAYVRTKVTGFALKKNSETKFEYVYDENELKLTLNMREATGWLSANDSYIKLVIPNSLMENNISLKLSTGKKSNININGDKKTKLSNLDVTLNRGKLYFDGLEAENIYIKANKAEIITGANVVGATNYMSLDINNSYVNLLYAGDGEKYLKNSIPEIDAINYRVENLVIKSANRNSDIRLFNCGFAYTATSCVANGGKISIYFLEKGNIDAVDCNIVIHKLTNNKEKSTFEFSGTGGLSVNENYGILNATTNSGKINIKMSDSSMLLETNKGKINVEKARKPISLITSIGKANIEFDKESEDNSYTVEREIISLRTYSGNIKIKGVDKISGVVDAGGDATIEIYYNKVIGETEIYAQNANLKIVVPKNEPITINLTCEKAMLDVHVGTITNEGEFNGDFVRTVYASSSDNILRIITSGKINIMSSDIYELKK